MFIDSIEPTEQMDETQRENDEHEIDSEMEEKRSAGEKKIANQQYCLIIGRTMAWKRTRGRER